MNNTGYIGYSMSARAQAAYNDGEMPISKWTKKNIITCIMDNIDDYSDLYDFNFSIEKLRKMPLRWLRENLLYNSSWHHTSKFYNKTEFYAIDYSELEKLTDELLEEELYFFKIQKQEEKKTPLQRYLEYRKEHYKLNQSERTRIMMILLNYLPYNSLEEIQRGYRRNEFKLFQEIQRYNIILHTSIF